MKIVSVLCLFLTSLLPINAQEKSAPKSGQPASKPMIVATFNGAPITEEDLRKIAANDFDKLGMDVDQMNSNIARIAHQIMETNLLHMLAEKIFDAEAAKRGVTKAALLETELQGKIKEPTQQDINAFYLANRQRFTQPLDKVSDQIRQYLSAQYRNKAIDDLADRLKPGYKVQMLLPPLRFHVADEGYPSLGPKNAPVTIVEFSDFQCEECSQLTKTLREVVDKYGNKVRLVYRQLPASQAHPLAEKAAEASLCAGDQNHFWEMHNLLFETQKDLKEEDLKAKAAQLKLDTAAFDKCLSSGKYAVKVKEDEREAYRLAVASSPSFFINGRPFSGAVPLPEISKAIDEEFVLKSSSAAPVAAGPPGVAALPIPAPAH